MARQMQHLAGLVTIKGQLAIGATHKRGNPGASITIVAESLGQAGQDDITPDVLFSHQALLAALKCAHDIFKGFDFRLGHMVHQLNYERLGPVIIIEQFEQLDLVQAAFLLLFVEEEDCGVVHGVCFLGLFCDEVREEL
jgi:hypothetical protein